jgi:hypothetical protein
MEDRFQRNRRRKKKGRSNGIEPARITAATAESNLGLGLPQPDNALALFPLATLPEQLDALEALENIALHGDAFGGLQAIML